MSGRLTRRLAAAAARFAVGPDALPMALRLGCSNSGSSRASLATLSAAVSRVAGWHVTASSEPAILGIGRKACWGSVGARQWSRHVSHAQTNEEAEVGVRADREAAARQGTAGAAEDLLISDACARQLLELGKGQEEPPVLRIRVDGGGCSGFQYKFELLDLANATDGTDSTSRKGKKKKNRLRKDDIVFEKEGARVCRPSMPCFVHVQWYKTGHGSNECYDWQVVVDKLSLDFIRGATVDYTEEMIRASFEVVENPNSSSSCGCGSSFSVPM